MFRALFSNGTQKWVPYHTVSQLDVLQDYLAKSIGTRTGYVLHKLIQLCQTKE